MNSPKCLPLLAGRGPLRALVGLLALLLVPVLIVTTPTVVQAAVATKYSGSSPAGFRYDSWQPGEWVDCTFTAFYAVTGDVTADAFVQAVKWKGGDCTTGANFNLEGASLSLTFSGTQANGLSCSGTGTTTLGTDEVIPDGSAWVHSADAPAAAMCEVQELCWSFDKPQEWARDLSGSGCKSLLMGPPTLPGAAPPSGTCSFGTFLGIHRQEYTDAGGTKYWEYRIKARVDVASLWGYRGIRGSYTSPTWIGGDDHEWTTPGTYTGMPGGSYSVVQMRVLQSQPQPWGFMVFVKSSTWNNGQNNWDQLVTLPQNSADGRLGTTVPANCWWYAGPKIATEPWTNTVTGQDAVGSDQPFLTDPLGTPEPPSTEPEPINDPPTSKPNECTFSLTDPTTWLEGGMCAAVGLLGAIWRFFTETGDGTLWGLLRDMVGWIGDLFAPEPGYLDARVDSTKDKLNDTTPGRWLDSFTDLTPGQVSGCGGIQVAPPNPAGEGTMFDVQLGAACSGSMANIAGLVRIAISAAVVIGGGLACIRALGSGLGWSPGVGRGESV